MFKLLMNLFFDVTGAIFFILKIVVVGIGKVFAFLVDAAVSLAGSSPGTDCEDIGIRPTRFDPSSYNADDRFVSTRFTEYFD